MPVAAADRRGVSFAAFAALIALYCVSPGHRGLLVSGLPLGPEGTVIVAAAIVLGVAFRGARFERRAFTAFAVAVALLLAARVAIGVRSAAVGWTARYYANRDWAGVPEWSSDFPRLDGTRVDRRIAFRDDTFPAHYLNDASFNRGDRREVTEPMSVEWRAFATLDAARTVRITLTARGAASLAVDGAIVVRTSAPANPVPVEQAVALEAGMHELVVRYLKPADTDGLIELRAVKSDAPDGSTALAVTPARFDPRPSGRLLPLARAIDAVLAILFVAVAAAAARLTWRRGGMAGPAWVTLALSALFGVQGWRQALPFAARVRPLTFGDDWWGFESCARDVLHHGPLMTLGKAIGQGDPYFYHPLYSYFLAAIHAVSGESLFGLVFVQFLVLAAVASIMWRFGAWLFGELPALAGLAALVVVFELDFARYYTVTLLSENLYILTVTLTLVAFVRWMQDGSPAGLIQTGFWGGVSTLTRPPMLFYLGPALALVALASAQRAGRLTGAVRPLCRQQENLACHPDWLRPS